MVTAHYVKIIRVDQAVFFTEWAHEFLTEVVPAQAVAAVADLEVISEVHHCNTNNS